MCVFISASLDFSSSTKQSFQLIGFPFAWDDVNAGTDST